MEKNTEKSSSFAKRDDPNQNDGGDNKDQTPRASESSLLEDQKDAIVADSDDPKTNDGNDDGDNNAATTTEAKADEEEKGNEENKDEVVAAEIEEVIESPSRSLEKASEDVDQYLEGGNSVLENIPDFVDKFLELVEEKIATYDSGDVKGKWGKNAEEDSSLLNFMDRISKLMKLLTTPSSTESSETWSSEEEIINKRRDSLVNQMGILEHRVMLYFEEEFRFSLMEESPKPGESEANNSESKGKQQQQQTEQDQNPQQTDQESTETETVNFPGYSEETITKLKQLAKEMKLRGYKHECCQVYTICRRFSFEENLIKIGFEKISMDDILKMQWKTLENHIPTWIKTFKDCITIYLPREKKLAESVFEFPDNPNISLTLFSDLSQGLVPNLINFAEGVAMTKRAPEKLFKILDMFEALRDVMPKFDELYPEESANDLKTDSSLAKSRLGEAMIHIFGDLENAIKTEAGKSVVPGGAVHPLTRYLMNYLPYACEYKETLEQVFKELSKIERADSTSRPHYEGSSNTNTTHANNSNHNHNNKNDEEQSPFQAQLVRLMSLLDFNLEAKAKQYRDLPLSSIFMMNNGRYILQKIKGSPEIYTLMGETWCRKRSSDLRTYHKNYQRETWTKILTCLSPEGLTVNGKVQKPLLKERFKSFNATFDEIHKTQSTWIVSDEQLQSELRVSITGLVIPAYRAFLGRFSQILDPGRQTEKYIKYQAEDIEPLIDELFDGNAPTTTKRRP